MLADIAPVTILSARMFSAKRASAENFFARRGFLNLSAKNNGAATGGGQFHLHGWPFTCQRRPE
jgi:hypothetical protein